MERGDRKNEVKCGCKGVTLKIRKSLRAMIRPLAFTLTLTGSYWRVLNRAKAWWALHFKKITLAAVWRTDKRTVKVAGRLIRKLKRPLFSRPSLGMVNCLPSEWSLPICPTESTDRFENQAIAYENVMKDGVGYCRFYFSNQKQQLELSGAGPFQPRLGSSCSSRTLPHYATLLLGFLLDPRNCSAWAPV